ncbi:hypothetical protein FJTKL_10229 [Diaporthe vaccinii]|uniref:C2H2-type domain-containing protein n=1 Tax=Diaporthe vaccinii TaxID=105482 RepID=A0ABR4EL11_9PEZI
MRIDTVLDALAKEGRLTTGKWRKRQRIGFALLCRICQAWFTRHLAFGCVSWDLPISKILPLVLMAATATRAGDITRANGYTGPEYLRWEHVELVLESDKPDINQMVAHITIAYEKGSKNLQNIDKVVVVEALDGVQQNIACPIKLLVIHGLRTGHIAHPSIKSLLDSLLLTPSRKVQWINASDPIIPALQRAKLDFSRPATPNQVKGTIKAAGLLAGILVPLNSHDIRAGTARDLSKLGSDAIKGVANPGVAKVLGHDYKTMSCGVTDSYIGGIDTAFNTEIAKNPRPDRFGPPLVDEGYFKSTRTTPARLTEFCKDNNFDPTSKKDRNTAAKVLERQNQREWAQKKTESLSAEGPKKIVQSRKSKTPTTSTLPLGEKSPNARPPKRQKNKDNKPDGGGTTDSGLDAVQDEPRLQPAAVRLHASPPDELIDPWLRVLDAVQDEPRLQPAAVESHTLPLDELIDPRLYDFNTVQDEPRLQPAAIGLRASPPDELIDPRLRDFDAGTVLRETGVDENNFDSYSVNTAAVSALESLVLGDSDERADMDGSQAQLFEDMLTGQVIGEAVDEIIADNNEDGRTPSNDPKCLIELDGTQFVDHFARINIVRNEAVASKSKEHISRYAPVGNSRDDPTLFQIPCPNAALGCEYTSTRIYQVNKHASSSNCIANQPEKLVQDHPCPRAGCDMSFNKKSALNVHIKNVHDWTPKKCELPDCPKADVLWSNGFQYSRHVTKYHDEDWTPTKCQVLGCKSSATWGRVGYDAHLKQVHKLSGEEKAKYLPHKTTPAFAPRQCPIPGCTSTSTWTAKASLTRHLKNVHKIDEEEIESIIV